MGGMHVLLLDAHDSSWHYNICTNIDMGGMTVLLLDAHDRSWHYNICTNIDMGGMPVLLLDAHDSRDIIIYAQTSIWAECLFYY